MKKNSILLITEGHPSKNGAGISQTLYNLFDHLANKIIVVLTYCEARPVGISNMQSSQSVLPKTRWEPIQNRLGKYLNERRLRKRLVYREKLIRKNTQDSSFGIVIVSTSVPEKLHLAWCMLQQGYTVVPYFMDDWLADNKLAWKGGNIQDVARDILHAAPCWLMISRQLEATLRKRYGLEKKPCLVVHNPAPHLSPQRAEKAVDKFPSTDNSKAVVVRSPSSLDTKRDLTKSQPSPFGGVGGGHLIIYAGSIWPMHADALIATAEAVHLMQETTSVVGCRSSVVPKLTIYTSESHWKKYRSQLEGPGITYGGWKPYSEVHKALQDAWLLLCTASFQDQYKAFSDSSVQTKLTDYMAVGKPVLFVGPADAASGVFVEEQDIGFTMGTNQPADIAARLEAISRMPAAWERKACNGLELAATTFSKPVVQQQLYDFLAQYALPSLEGWPKAGVVKT